MRGWDNTIAETILSLSKQIPAVHSLRLSIWQYLDLVKKFQWWWVGFGGGRGVTPFLVFRLCPIWKCERKYNGWRQNLLRHTKNCYIIGVGGCLKRMSLLQNRHLGLYFTLLRRPPSSLIKDSVTATWWGLMKWRLQEKKCRNIFKNSIAEIPLRNPLFPGKCHYFSTVGGW